LWLEWAQQQDAAGLRGSEILRFAQQQVLHVSRHTERERETELAREREKELAREREKEPARGPRGEPEQQR